ncbi:SufD family Fe-S cluster assembly protein [Candidatus Woesearchaeota archaeon]|nr:SufD family Fe-S cluster assembly protein [Candidatus Woesearchaeota archaeon]
MKTIQEINKNEIEVTSLNELKQEQKELLERYCKTIIPTQGVYVQILKKTSSFMWRLASEKPIHTVFIIEKNANVTITLEYATAQEQFIYFIIEKNATCTLFEHAEQGSKAIIEAICLEKATLNSTALILAEAEVDMQRNYYLQEPHASVLHNEVVWGRKQSSHTNKINILHKAPCTKSNVKIKEVLHGAAKSRTHGIIQMEKTAIQASSFLGAYALLLHKDAFAQIIPALEIENCNIQKAGHATAVSPLDEDDIFYLVSRGIEEQEAKKLLVRGFIQDALQELSEEQQDQLWKRLEEQWQQ